MLNLGQKRILIVDDNEAIHEDFRKVLAVNSNDTSLDETKLMVFPDIEKTDDENAVTPCYLIDSAYQGQEALELVKKAVSDRLPYALAFVDIRMPPGWDGVETIKQIWEVDSMIQIVICTAHSDYTWQSLSRKLKISDGFLILKKPFDAIEVCQFASALTKKWELKKLVQQQVETLETTIQERTAELRRAKEMAEAANRVKSEFLENMSLELRTPLTNIIGFSDVVYRTEIDLAHLKEYCSHISSSAKYLSQLISDILDVAEIESGKIEFYPEPVDLNTLVNEIRDIHHALMTEKHLQFNIKIDPSLTNIATDSARLKQILFHYVSNAIKFTPNDGKVEIRIFPFNARQFRIEVVDTGIGIREEDISKLFISFQQLDESMAKKYQGTGLGLALVLRIVEAQGGQVGVESTFGKGSTFFAILPRTLPKRAI